MLTIEEVRSYLFLFAFILAGFAIIAYAWRNPSGALKLLCIVAVVALGIAGFAMAEEAEVDEIKTVDFRKVEAVMFNGEACLRITFSYNGKLLSWYDNMFLPYVEYNVTVFAGEEVIDAEPAVDAVSR